MINRLASFVLTLFLLLFFTPTLQAQGTFTIAGTVRVNANLRAGPGTDTAIIGRATSGQTVTIVAANSAGDWYQLDNGAWIAASLVTPTVPATPTTKAQPLARTLATVLGITDGDTISVNVNGVLEELRYIGIDTPERNEPGYLAAANANRRLVAGKTVSLVRDVSDRDQYGRLLRYVYLPDGTFVNAELVAQGWAQPVAFPPDTAQYSLFVQKAVAAAQARHGFWAGAAAIDGVMPYALSKTATPLYQVPGAGNPITAQLATDTPLTVYGRTGDSGWLQVRTPRRDEGWVATSAVTLNVPVSKLTVAGSTSTATYTCDEDPSPPPDPACPIKGNISSSGRIYHRPGQDFYCKTVIDTGAGERWFCSAAEAEAAGWRAAKK